MDSLGFEAGRPGFTSLSFHHLTPLWSGVNSGALLSKLLLCSKREECGSPHQPQAENSSDTGHHHSPAWSAPCPGRTGWQNGWGGLAQALIYVERADSQRGEQQGGGLNKGREDKAVVPENSGECRGGPKCQRPEDSALSPRSLLTTLETMGAIWYTLMVSQALCQALDWLNFPSWEAGNGIHPPT